MCFVPPRRALFRHFNFQKCSEPVSFLQFWLRNTLRATTGCTLSTSQLPKVLWSQPHGLRCRGQRLWRCWNHLVGKEPVVFADKNLEILYFRVTNPEAGLRQPGSWAAWHGFFGTVWMSGNLNQIAHLVDVAGPCPSRTVVANSNRCKNKCNKFSQP